MSRCIAVIFVISLLQLWAPSAYCESRGGFLRGDSNVVEQPSDERELISSKVQISAKLKKDAKKPTKKNPPPKKNSARVSTAKPAKKTKSGQNKVPVIVNTGEEETKAKSGSNKTPVHVKRGGEEPEVKKRGNKVPVHVQTGAEEPEFKPRSNKTPVHVKRGGEEPQEKSRKNKVPVHVITDEEEPKAKPGNKTPVHVSTGAKETKGKSNAPVHAVTDVETFHPIDKHFPAHFTVDAEEYKDSSSGIEVDYRFSKVFFEPSVTPPDHFLPLTSADFPVSGDVARILRQSNVHSVVTPDDHEVYMPMSRLIDAVGGLPIHVSGDKDSPFWDEFRVVIEAQKERRAKTPASEVFPLPKVWKGYNLDQVAEAVHDEYPGKNQALHIESYLLRDDDFEIDEDIIPQRGMGHFLRKEVMLADLNTWAIGMVAPHNFMAKWYAGRARPEEVAFLISSGQLTEGVPEDVLHDIKSFNMQYAPDFTAYPEGSPPHPSWPAMHSAASCASFWLSVVLNMNERQLCEIRMVDYGVAFARTVAGVHYPTDNIDGLNMGLDIVAEFLGGYLALKYGADEHKVNQKIERMKYDWNHYDKWACVRKYGS